MLPLKDDIPHLRRPLFTVGLILASTAVFFWQVSWPLGFEHSVYQLGLRPAELWKMGTSRGWEPLATIFTSMFAHGSLLHLGSNLLFLWIFGNNVEDAMGHWRFLLFYLLCGVAAAAAQVAWMPTSPIPMVGASGAIAGVLGAYFLLYPRARVLTLVPIFFFIRLVWIPAFFFLGLWFLFQILGGLGSGPGGGVAFWAHVGGFVAGVVLVRPFTLEHARLRARRRMLFR